MPLWNIYMSFCIQGLNSSLSFLEGVYSLNLIPRWDLSRGEIIPVYSQMSLTIYIFWPILNFMKKEKKRRIDTSSRNRILQWPCFYLVFATYVLNMLSNFNMFEHSASQQEYFIGTFHKKWGLENHYNLFSL